MECGGLTPRSSQEASSVRKAATGRSDQSADSSAHSKRVKTLSTNERDLIVGGQAVIEGVMMRTPNAYAIAVRKADGTIVNTAARLPKWSDKYPMLKLPGVARRRRSGSVDGPGHQGAELFGERSLCRSSKKLRLKK